MTTHTPEAVAEFIRSLSPAEKDVALVELVREAIRQTGGRSVLPVRGLDGESLGYYVPPMAAQDRLGAIEAQLTHEQIERSRVPLDDPNDTFDMNEFIRQWGESPETPNR